MAGHGDLEPVWTFDKDGPTAGHWAGWVDAVDPDTGGWKGHLKSNDPIVSGMTPAPAALCSSEIRRSF